MLRSRTGVGLGAPRQPSPTHLSTDGGHVLVIQLGVILEHADGSERRQHHAVGLEGAAIPELSSRKGVPGAAIIGRGSVVVRVRAMRPSHGWACRWMS